LQVQLAKDPKEWNTIVERSPYSVLHHRYELCAPGEGALPLIIKEQNHNFLFPLRVTPLFKSFRLASSPIFYHASLLPDSETLYLVPEVLEKVTDFLREMRVDYLSTSAATFLSRQHATILNSWFKKKKASIQVIYAHMIHTKNKTFEEIWKRFRKRTREEIRKAQREGVSVIKIDTVDSIYKWMDDIHQCNVSALKRQGRWGAYPDSYKEVFLSELVSDKRLLGEHYNIYGAVCRGHLIAYMIFQEYNKLIALTKAASQTEFLAEHPNEVLIAHIVKEACERGFHWLQYTFDRARHDEKIPSLYSSLRMFKFKFGFEEVPIPIYRLGLTPVGRMIQYLYSGKQYFITRSAYIPESVRAFYLRLYAPRRRRFSVFVEDTIP